MVKRKRNHEPSLEDKLTQWHKELARGMKTAKGFERQRLSKRIREAQVQNDADKVARLEREVAVLKVRRLPKIPIQTGNHRELKLTSGIVTSRVSTFNRPRTRTYAPRS